jgi:hypothetical protein
MVCEVSMCVSGALRQHYNDVVRHAALVSVVQSVRLTAQYCAGSMRHCRSWLGCVAQ